MRDLHFFHLTGTRLDAALTPPAQVLPALFARFHDLTALRYDFPVVLVESEVEFARSLTTVIDELLREIAPRGMAGERMRRSVLRLEREIRVLVGKGAFGSLTSLWQRAADRLATRGGTPVASDLANARAALHVDGEVVDCDARLPERLVTHAWRMIETRRMATMRRHIDGLIARLDDLLRADHLRSRSGRTPAALRSAIGENHQELFDFDAMARLLAKPSGESNLSDARRKRIQAALETLRSEPFFGAHGGFEFTFSRADVALAAFRERLPALARLVRAIAIAELEVEGEYVEATHDDYFATVDERALRPEDLARFPSYLVRIEREQGDARRTQLLEALSSSAPLKLLVVSDDLLEISSGELAVSFETRLATSAIGLGAFVLQSPSSHLCRVRDQLSAALSAPGPSLVSVFSGAIPGASAPPYLVAAAALESRAFPTFIYDPAATVKLSLDGNPQPERTWPEHELTYADAAQQRVVERVPFTFADFAAADRLLGSHFSRVPADRETGNLVDVRAWLEDGPDWRRALPFVYGVDLAQHVQKLVVDEQLVRAARRSIAGWLRLRELAPHAVTAPAANDVPPAAPDAAPPVHEAPAPVATDAGAPVTDEPYIETPRCTSCNECVLLDGAMFAYNENKQAFIKDPSAGPFRTLVEAAEGCQVAIIHPGRPRDPNESGLEELLRRAEPFR